MQCLVFGNKKELYRDSIDERKNRGRYSMAERTHATGALRTTVEAPGHSAARPAQREARRWGRTSYSAEVKYDDKSANLT